MINIAFLTVRTGTSCAEREICGQTTSETTIDTECVEVRGYAKYDVRARFNEQRKMEVWLVKLGEEFTEEGLLAWADEDPQGVADLARMGEAVFYNKEARERQVISQLTP